MTSDGGGRLGRWARRKAEAKRRGAAAPVVQEPPAGAPVAAAPPVAGGPVAQGHEPVGAATQPATDASTETPAEPDLPDIETLNADSDFSAFMKEGVPAQLRRLALRKLWASDPIFNHIDVMVEYGEDYTDAAMVVEGLKSSWEVGRGYARPNESEVAADRPPSAAGGDAAQQDERPAVAEEDNEEHGAESEPDADAADAADAPADSDGEKDPG